MAAEYTQEEISLYEGDQSKLYSGVFNHHKGKDINAQGSKEQVKRFIKIMIYLGIVTLVEVSLGLWDHHTGLFAHAKGILIALFFIMTLFKAYLIIDVFMHLGDEIRNFVMAVFIPLILIIWAIIALIGDGDFWHNQHIAKPGSHMVTTEQTSTPVK